MKEFVMSKMKEFVMSKMKEFVMSKLLLRENDGIR